MKTASYIWTIILNLFVLFIVIAVLGRFTIEFERIVVIILMLIYISIWGYAKSLAWQNVEIGVGTAEEFYTLKRFIVGTEEESQEKDYRVSSTEQEYESSKKRTEEFLHKQKIKYYINLGFASLLQIILLWSLISIISS